MVVGIGWMGVEDTFVGFVIESHRCVQPDPLLGGRLRLSSVAVVKGSLGLDVVHREDVEAIAPAPQKARLAPPIARGRLSDDAWASRRLKRVQRLESLMGSGQAGSETWSQHLAGSLVYSRAAGDGERVAMIGRRLGRVVVDQSLELRVWRPQPTNL